MMKDVKILVGLIAVVYASFGAARTSGVVSVRTGGGMNLEEGFVTPPVSARPQTWWHWMNGNVTKEGVTADLEAMKAIGLGGASLFDAGCAVPEGPLKFNSSEWFDMVKFAAEEAQRLGLSICLPNCSGWSSSGGPWNPPENGMKFLDFTETVVTGGRRVETPLKPIPDRHGFAADIAVLAVPVTAAEKDDMKGARIDAPEKFTRVVTFPAPREATGLFFRFDYKWCWGNGRDGRIRLEASSDGRTFTEVFDRAADLSRRGEIDATERFEPFGRTVTGRVWRVTAQIARELTNRVTLASVSIGRRHSLSHLQDKILHNRNEIVSDQTPAAPDQTVAKGTVRDVTACLGKDGVLRWDAPAGDWRIVRLGFAANGKRNSPASAHGAGPEVDKLSASALDFHFDAYAAKLARHLGPAAGHGETGLTGILVDSYEVACQNWTQGFEREFLRRRGYDMSPYLAVLAGTVVGSVDESERFLWDYRRTIADLFQENYSGALAKKCHAYGLTLSLEPYGNCPCDDLEYGENADLPMGEFWSGAGRGDFVTRVGNVKLPSYVAHVWGKRVVGAEAFTADPGSGGRWTTTPWSLKAQGDRAFARGVNRLIFHRFAHQPWTKPARLPGMTMGRWGMHLDRTQTWWHLGRPWMDYLARCQWLLQEGTFAADVLFWHGEEAPNRGGHVVDLPEDYADCPVPDGFDRDVCSTRALKALRVENGTIVAPGGTRYALLVLQDVEAMTLGTLEAVGRIVAAGARVAAPRRPTRSPSLADGADGDRRVNERAAAIWAQGVIRGGAREGLAALGREPDFLCLTPEYAPKTAFLHRTYGAEGEGYFVATANERAAEVVCSFRQDGREPEVWDAESGEIRPPRAWRRVNGRTEVRLAFPPSGSAFVMFRRKTAKTGGETPAAPAPGKALALPKTVQATFPVDWYAGGTAKKTVTIAAETDWMTLDDPDLKYFSGTASYDFGAVAAGRLDLGTVKNFAEVLVDGRRVKILWRPPYACEIPAGRLEVRVTNLWPNRLIGDDRLFDDDCKWWRKVRKGPSEVGLSKMPEWVLKGEPSPTGRHTFATWRHWGAENDLLPSGILGPVSLRATSALGDQSTAK